MPTPIPVVIHFAGLVLFSSQVPNDCGLKAILPKVVHSGPMTSFAHQMPAPAAPRAALVSYQRGQTAPIGIGSGTPLNPPHVEDHVAILVFKTGSYLPSSNFGPPIPLPGTNDYQYIKLDGERIRFESGIQGQGLATNLKLPKLEQLCSMSSLNTNFQPPYVGAAAVFDLPQGNVKGCQFHNQRFDTEVTLNSSGFLTVSASTMRTRKDLRLRPLSGTIELIVANVPARCLTTGCSQPSATASGDLTHVHAYYEMADSATACITVTAWLSAHSADAATNSCSMTTLPNAAGGYVPEQKRQGGDMATQGDNFECSNSAWP